MRARIHTHVRSHTYFGYSSFVAGDCRRRRRTRFGIFVQIKFRPSLSLTSNGHTYRNVYPGRRFAHRPSSFTGRRVSIACARVAVVACNNRVGLVPSPPSRLLDRPVHDVAVTAALPQAGDRAECAVPRGPFPCTLAAAVDSARNNVKSEASPYHVRHGLVAARAQVHAR